MTDIVFFLRNHDNPTNEKCPEYFLKSNSNAIQIQEIQISA